MQTNTLARTANTPARAANACLGAHDGRWISLPEVKHLLALTAPNADQKLAMRTLAGALRNGRVRLSPKAAAEVRSALPLSGTHPQAHTWLAGLLDCRTGNVS